MVIATAKDIALKAGVCRQTVSAVLAGETKKVSPQKRELILKLAKEMNYRPNPNAKSLAGQSTRTIGLLIPVYISTISAELIATIQEMLRNNFYQCYTISPINVEEGKKAIDEFCSRGVDGIIICNLQASIDQAKYPVPIVVVSTTSHFDCSVDYKYGIKLALQHLYQKHGHRRIAFLTDKCNSNQAKYEGYLEFLKEKSINQNNWVIETTKSLNHKSNIKHLINTEKITAFVATGDILAGQFINYVERLGIHVPENIAVTGYDGTFLCQTSQSQLSAVVHPIKELVEISINILFDKMKNNIRKVIEKPILVKPYFYKGQTCGCNGIDNSLIDFHVHTGAYLTNSKKGIQTPQKESKYFAF